MSETGMQSNADLPRPPSALLILHAVQLLLAILVMGLAAYSVRYIAYKVLVYSLVVALCTILVCIYLIASQKYMRKLYNPWFTTAYHLWMLIFWIVDLGLIAHLAKRWQGPECTYDFRNGYACAPYDNCDKKAKRTTTYGTFYGALVAGAVLAAFELLLWVTTAGLLFKTIRKVSSAESPTQYAELNPTPPSNLEEIPLTPKPAPWDDPVAQTNRPGPQPLIEADYLGFSRDDISHTLRQAEEFENHDAPHAVFVQEQDLHGTPTSCPPEVGQKPTDIIFRITNPS